MSQNLLSAAVVIGALRVKELLFCIKISVLLYEPAKKILLLIALATRDGSHDPSESSLLTHRKGA